MSLNEIADRVTQLGFEATLDQNTVWLNEAVWVLTDAADEVWDRYVEIRAHLRANGLDLPLGLATLEHDHISGAVIALDNGV